MLTLSARFRLSSEFGWIVFGNALAMVLSLLGIRALTEFLPPIQFGRLYLLLTFSTFIQSVIFGPIGASAARFRSISVQNSSTREFRSAFFRFLVLASLLTCVLGLSAWIVSETISGTVSIDVLVVLLVFSVSSASFSAVLGVLNADRKRKWVAFYRITEQWARYTAAVICIIIIGETFRAALFGFALAYVSLLIFNWRKASRLGHDQSGVEQGVRDEGWFYSEMFGYAWPFAVWGVFYWMQNASDRWALEILVTTHEVGLYSALYQLGYLPMLLACSLGVQFAQPIIFAFASRSDSAGVRNAWQATRALGMICMSGTVIVTALAFFFHDLLFALIAGSNYREVSYLLPFSLLAGGLFSTGQGLELFLLSGTSTIQLLPVKIATSIIGAVGSFIGAHLAGIEGVVIASVIASTIFCIWMWMMALSERRRLELSNC